MTELTSPDAIEPAADALAQRQLVAPTIDLRSTHGARYTRDTVTSAGVRAEAIRLRAARPDSLFTTSVDRVLSVMDAGIAAQSEICGPLDRGVISRQFQLGLTLRMRGHHAHAIPRLADVIVASQRADLIDSGVGPSSDTLQAKHALRDSLRQNPVGEEIARRAFAEGNGLRGPGSTGLASIDAVRAEFAAIAGHYDIAIPLAVDVRDDLRAEYGSDDPRTILATARLALIANEAEDTTLAARTLGFLATSANADRVSQALHAGLGAWERDRFSALKA
jgi:hypothetical protein